MLLLAVALTGNMANRFNYAQETGPIIRAGDDAPSSEYARVLRTLIEAGRKNFTGLKGPPVPNGMGMVWKSTLILPGAEECEIWNYRDRAMGDNCKCRISRSAQWGTLVPSFEKHAESINSSLSRGWVVQEQSSKEFRATENGSSISVELAIISTSDGYELRTTISIPPDK
jgi:hypothetical protein